MAANMDELRTLTREDAVQVITEMVQAYRNGHDGKMPRALIAVGGAAMALHNIRPISNDIDLYAPEDAFLPIALDLEKRTGIRIDVTSKTNLFGHINVRDVEQDAQVLERVTMEGFQIDIAAISPETLFVIKASTMREKDRADLPGLWNVVTPQDILKRTQTLLPNLDTSWTGEETLLNILSEMRLSGMSQVEASWFRDAPVLAKKYASLIEEAFGVDILRGVEPEFAHKEVYEPARHGTGGVAPGNDGSTAMP